MKYVLILLLLISFYGFWQWLDRVNSKKIETTSDLSLVKEMPVSVQMSSQRCKRKKHIETRNETPLKEHMDQEITEDIDEDEKYKRGRDSLLIVLSDSGIDLDDIATALNEMNEDDNLSSEEYLEELLYLLPNKSRETLEDLIDRKIILAEHFKDFFHKFINGDMNTVQDPYRYPGHNKIGEEFDEYERIEY